MYTEQPDQAGEWIPILQHIRNTAPGLTELGVRHIADFTTLSKRAEEEAQKVTRYPWSAHHTDGRIVSLWQGGGGGTLRPNTPGVARRKAQKRHRDTRSSLAAEAATGSGTKEAPSLSALATREQITVADQSDEEIDEGMVPDSCTAAGGGTPALTRPEVSTADTTATSRGEAELQEATRSEETSDVQLGRSDRLFLEWDHVKPGKPRLVVQDDVTRAHDGTYVSDPGTHKQSSLGPRLQGLNIKCSICMAGMAPPSIDTCPKCSKAWWHTACAELAVTSTGVSHRHCKRCSQLSSCYAAITTVERCSHCEDFIVDNCCDLTCRHCQRHQHVSCALADSIEMCPDLTSEYFVLRRVHRPTRRPLADEREQSPWTCGACRAAGRPAEDELLGSVHDRLRADEQIDHAQALADVRLPVTSHAPPELQLDEWFQLHLSEEHVDQLGCKWTKMPLADFRHDMNFRDVETLLAGVLPEVQTKLRSVIAGTVHMQCLYLLTERDKGSQVLACTIFSQRNTGTTPYIICMGIQPSLQRQGLGSWMLSWLSSAHLGRELLVKSVPACMEFFEAHDFLPAGTTVRLPAIGPGATMRRHYAQGAVFPGSLRSALIARQLRLGGQGPWTSPGAVAAGATQNACFTLATLQLLLGIPQCVELLCRRPGPRSSIQALLERILEGIVVGENAAGTGAAVNLLRTRLCMNFGQNETPRRDGQKADNSRMDFGLRQQDPEELLDALLLSTDKAQPLGKGDTEEEGAPTTLSELMTWPGMMQRTCKTCGKAGIIAHTDNRLSLPPQGRRVETARDLLAACTKETLDSESTWRPTGCSCANPVMRSTIFMEALPTVLNLNIPRAMDVAAPGQSGGKRMVRNTDEVYLPRVLRLTLGEEQQIFVLRAVILNSGTETTASGHYVTARFEEAAAFLCNGAEVTRFALQDSYFRPSEHEACQGFLPTKACFSRAGAGENNPTSQMHDFTMPVAPAQDILLTVSGATSRPRRTGMSTAPGTYAEAIAFLTRLVSPTAPFTILSGAGSTAEHLARLRQGLDMAHSTETPAFFWYPGADPSWLASLQRVQTFRAGAELQGRGRITSLSALTQLVDREHGSSRGRPVTATQALQGGLDASAGGRALLRQLGTDLNILLCGENGLLLSTSGLVTPCHLHAGGVLNLYLASCSWDAVGLHLGKRMVITPTQASGVSRGRKEYILFSSRTLAEAGFDVYDTSIALELPAVLLRIAQMNEWDRQDVRWWHGTLDGCTFNALICQWPPTTYHWVHTVSEGRQSWVYAGLATQYGPKQTEHQQLALAELHRTKMDSTRRVIERPHLSKQPSSLYIAEVLQSMLLGAAAADINTWHEMGALAQMEQAIAAATKMLAAKDPAGAKGVLTAALQAMKNAGGGEASHSRAEELIAQEKGSC